ncbi:NADH dehydrogenase [ubiquinone] 1 alpha subcomplex subunit 13 [Anthonomus grandis grandis]|uniref:NADH dehydrogenase [ubiquinone] 1 alpha subcomplex subunit 13 n=1 Tax=Anthonomus grandis grandis TaxID=2921223 RepID=UPI00216537DF|nr:NADH dehydrogenase [ubiquinone] 1 alpha subcomplex subunit 13 [Anthonomus grandis grandis]
MTEFRQEMPPEGGYRPINIKRVPPRSYFGGYSLIGGLIGMTTGAAYLFYLNVGSVYREQLEVKGASLAVYPMLMAERDRAFLKQLRINREEERELMKNVPGWKVGTWYGEPIFVGEPNKYVDPRIQEFYVHSSWKEASKRMEFMLKS